MLRTVRRLALLAATALAAALPLAACTPLPPPVSLIIDTDMHSDVDDVGALALANVLTNRGEARLLGVMVDTPSRWAAPAAAAINTYYGHGSVPVGALKPVDDSTFGARDYARTLATSFPNSLADGSRAPDAVTLYRQLLAGQPDRSVTVAAIGFETNLSRLLTSPPDRFSPLTGHDLVARKVKQVVMMGGGYPTGAEFNFTRAPEAARTVVNRWPARVVFSGGEVGATILTGEPLHSRTPASNPVRRAYELYVGPGRNRPSWDLTAVYVAVRGTDGLFALAGAQGSNTVGPTGTNAWSRMPDKDQNYLMLAIAPARIAAALDQLLISAPH